MTRTVDSIPVAFTPSGGWLEWPPLVLDGCADPLPASAPDLRGFWQVIEVKVEGNAVDDHPTLGSVARNEQAGDRIVITSGGVVHDMRCDGTLEHGVHDVAAFDKTTPVNVVATYEDGVHVLRPDGLPIEVKRWRDGDDLLWDYIGFTARMRLLGPTTTDPNNLDLTS